MVICCLLITRLDQLDLGVRLDKDQIQAISLECVATPSQTYRCTPLTIEGVKIAAGYDETLRIRYLTTQDRKFRTPEGLHVGMWMRVSENELVAITGWKILGPKAKSGWRPVFGDVGEKVKFADGTVVDPSRRRYRPPRRGELRIVELEKGGV